MIKNMKQLEITLNSIGGFKEKRESIAQLGKINKIQEIELKAIDSIVQDLEKQVETYEKIINKEYIFDTIESFDQISQFIIGKRIQKNLDEAALASKLGINEAQYNWLEENDFYGIDEELLNRLLSILDIRIKEGVFAEENVNKFDKVLSNLKTLGINDGLIKQTIGTDLREVKNLVKQRKSEAAYVTSRFIHYFKKVFGLNLKENLSGINTLEQSLSVAFKKPVNIKTEMLSITTGYAAYIASIISRQVEGKCEIFKPDPITIRANLIKKYGEISLEAVLDYIWKLKIPVVPINIKSGFHGACFDFSGIRAIVLNQQHGMVSRWKFDLLHEFYHALTLEHNFYLEQEDREQQINKDEIRASRFANYVIFGSDAETFLKIAVEETGGDIRLLKTTLQETARKYNLDIDDFSNYAAYRLTMQGISWWGVAKNLQKRTQNPYNILLDYLLKNINIDNFSDFEKNLIISTFNRGETNNGD